MRIVKLVELLKKNKSEFARDVNVTPAYISKLGKQPKAVPSDRFISDICRKFNVNETWLRTGEGEIFLEEEDAFISQIADRYHLDNFDKETFKLYLNLSPDDRRALTSFSFSLVSKILEHPALYREYKRTRGKLINFSEIDIEAEVAAYRTELELMKKEENVDTPAVLDYSSSCKNIPQEMTREEIHAELDRQLDAEKEATEESSDYGFGCSDAATG